MFITNKTDEFQLHEFRTLFVIFPMNILLFSHFQFLKALNTIYLYFFQANEKIQYFFNYK